MYSEYYNTSVILLTDLETTGLSARHDLLLEAGLVVLDSDTLQLLDHLDVVISSEDTVKWAMAAKVTPPHDRSFVQNMHIENNLVDDILEPGDSIKSVHSTHEADDVMIRWLVQRGLENRPLVGASVGSLDRPFMIEHLPLTNAMMNHRNVDTSSIASAVGLFDQEKGGRLRDEAFLHIGVEETAHRVVDDCVHAAKALKWVLTSTGLI